VTTASAPEPTTRGVVRLLNTSGGRLLCLAGEVDGDVVDSFLLRYGREPAPVEAVDVRSVTALSDPGLELVVDHLRLAELTGRAVAVHCAPQVGRLLAGGLAERSR
jgi:hypothetical protein